MSASKRALLATTLARSGALRGLRYLRRGRPARVLPALAYHRIADDAGPFFAGVVEATPARFRAQMDVFARHARALGTADIARACELQSLPPRAAFLSFDDAYRSCVDIVLPILEARALRACFFVATRHVTERRLFWWDAIAWLVRARPERLDRVRVDCPEPRSFVLGPGAELERRGIVELASLVERTPGLDPELFVAELARALGVAWDRDRERTLADELLMSWDDLRLLRDAGHEIQSHTRSHRVLQTLEASALASELAGARADLRERLGVDADAIAYPCGYPVRAASTVDAALRAAGYRLGFTYGGGCNRVGALDPFELRRTAIPAGLGAAQFEAMLALPWLAHRSPRALGFGV